MPAAAFVQAIPTLNGITVMPPPINGAITFKARASGKATAVQKLPGIRIGSTVVTMNQVNVRATPAGALLGTQPTGASARVMAGPVTANFNNIPVIWWSLAFPTGVSGHVGDNNLKLGAPVIPPTYLSAQVRIILHGIS